MKAAFLTAILFSVSIVLAAEGDGDSVRYALPEQTVTGTRREFRWLENPTAITALTLRDQPVNRGLGLSDNLLLVPGLVSTSRFGTDDIRLSMRGMGARSNSGVRGVRVLYDGIPESEPDGQTRLEGIDAGSLDRVEVLRGSGSALYGNAAGGVVNLRTAEHFPRAGALLDVRGGGFGFYKVKASAGSGPALSDSAITASLDFRDGSFDLEQGARGEGGTISVSHTKTDGWREHSAYAGQIVSGSYTAHAAPRSDLRTVFYFTNVLAELPGTLTRTQFNADELQADSVYKALNVLRYTRKGRLGLIYERRFDHDVRLHFTPYAALKKLDRPRENGKWQAITRYILGGTLQGEIGGELADRYETELIAGMDQQLQDGPVTFYANVHGARGDSILSQEQERQWGQGYFVQWEVENKGRWGAVLGGRYDRLYYFDDFLSDPTPTATYERGAFTPRAAFRCNLRKELLAFASLSGGFETPTLTESENTLGVNVKPQKTLTVELGLRGEQPLHGIDARWEVAAYRMIVTDAIVPDRIAGERLFTNAGEAVHQGIEISAKLARPRIGYAGVAASIGEFVFTDYATGLGDFTNKKLPGVSPDLLSAVVRWTPREWLFAETTARTSGAAFTNTENTEQAAGYAIFGAAIGGKLPVTFLSAAWHAGVQNLFDRKYTSFIQVNDSKGRYYETGMPRAIMVGVTVGTPGL